MNMYVHAFECLHNSFILVIIEAGITKLVLITLYTSNLPVVLTFRFTYQFRKMLEIFKVLLKFACI